MKRISLFLLFALTILTFIVTSVSANHKSGDPLGWVLSSDVTTYIDGYPIRSYNINGYTYIVVEDLMSYGFNVEWRGTEAKLVIHTSRTAAPNGYTATYQHTANTEVSGIPVFQYLYTNITTWIDNKQIVGYNIGGNTCICMDDLAAVFSKEYVWNSADASLRLTTQTVGTAYGNTVEEHQSVLDMVDFIVNVEEERPLRVMQITDTQIIESEQMRTPTRLTGSALTQWSKTKKEENCYGFVRKAVEAYDPDLIIITGDFVYGEFDDTGEAFLDEIEFFDSLKTPWAPVFGNHDNESKKGVDWQCEQFENSEYCLFKQRELTGNGNYTVGIAQGGELKRVFFMLDSNGCGAASGESMENGHTQKTAGFADDQIQWYTKLMEDIKRESPDTKLSVAFHIQLAATGEAMAQYGSVPLDLYEIGKNGDYGYINSGMKTAWDNDKAVYNGMKKLGVDSIFNGHEHCNNGSILYDGIRFVYGLKSSRYDRYNRIAADGSLVTNGGVTPYVGGTAIDLNEDGSIKSIYHIVSSVELPKPEEDESDKTETVSITLDFNGRDFDATVNTSGIKNSAASLVSDISTTPTGFSGEVYYKVCGSSSSLAAVGIKAGDSIDFERIKSFKVRMYVSEYTPAKSPLIRTYNDKDNMIQNEAQFATLGGVQGEWCEVEIKDLVSKYVNNGKLDDFVLVYRFYSDGVETPQCYFDSITISYT